MDASEARRITDEAKAVALRDATPYLAGVEFLIKQAAQRGKDSIVLFADRTSAHEQVRKAIIDHFVAKGYRHTCHPTNGDPKHLLSW